MEKALPVALPPPKPSKEMLVLVPMLAYTPVPRRKRTQCSQMPRLLNSGCLSPLMTRLVSMLSLALAGRK
eukprot:3690617-Karenia_brevis.AAC.1